MKRHDPELLNALVDGELKGGRRFFVERHLRGCTVCAREYRQLRRVRAMLESTAANAPVMTESAEFFWTKIKRQIQAQHSEQIEVPGVDTLRQQQPVLAICVAVVVAVLAVVWTLQHRMTTAPTLARNSSRTAAAIIAKIERVSTVIPDTDATALQDDGVAVIWVSGLPWTADMTAMKTHYANLDI
jgi:anti-sigma factor RsiW